MSTVENGNTVSVHYKGTFSSGEEFDSSYTRDQPMTFTVGSGETIAGFDSAVVGMSVGDTKNITISPENGYGEVNEEAFQNIPKTQFLPDFDPKVGGTVEGVNQTGQKIRAVIKEVHEEHITLDFNHPLAGKEMNFEIHLVDIK